MEEVRETLRLLVAQSRETTVCFRLDEWKLSVDEKPVPPAATGFEELIGQLYAHRVRELVIRQFACAAELIKLVRLLAEGPAADAATLLEKIAALKLWNVELTLATESAHAAPELPTPEHVVVTHHLARIRTASLPLDATHALGELVTLAEAHVAAGRAEPLAEILSGIVKAEKDATDAAISAACGKAIDQLAKPAVARLVAQLLPTLQGRPRDFEQHLHALGRCGNPGAAALIAHLMAADSFDDRRVFYNAIVELRTGVPMLIDALGHPQWFVVRNAASLLGEMREPQADGALARLLEHRDERVREAAAAALSCLDTPTSRAALQRMIQDRSPHVRLHAASAFASSGQTKTATPLSTALDAESDGDVQLGIIQALGRLGTPDAVQKLVRAVLPTGGRPRPVSYRIAALEALAAARGHSAHPTFRTLLNDAEPAVREAAKRLIAMTAMA
jgi:HEAT repeat protein